MAPGHGAANASQGLIDRRNGEAELATRELTIAAESISSVAARHELQRAGVPYRPSPAFTRLLSRPEYFSASFYRLPLPQQSLQEEAAKEAEKNAFLEAISRKQNALGDSIEGAASDMQRIVGSALSGSGAMAVVYPGLDRQVYGRAVQHLVDAAAEFAAGRDAAQAKMAALRQGLEASWDGNPTEQCGAAEAALEQNLHEQAAVYKQFEDTYFKKLRREVSDITNYPFLYSSPLTARAEYLGYIQKFAGAVGDTAALLPLESPICRQLPRTSGTEHGPAPDEPDCPLKLSFNVHVVKIKMTCTELSFEFEAGLDFKATKNFRSGETSLTGGVGADVGALNVEGTVVITWDRNNNLSHVGLETGMSAQIGSVPGLSGAVETAVTGEDAGLKGHDLVDVSTHTSIGVSLGPNGVEPEIGGDARLVPRPTCAAAGAVTFESPQSGQRVPLGGLSPLSLRRAARHRD